METKNGMTKCLLGASLVAGYQPVYRLDQICDH